MGKICVKNETERRYRKSNISEAGMERQKSKKNGKKKYICRISAPPFAAEADNQKVALFLEDLERRITLSMAEKLL